MDTANSEQVRQSAMDSGAHLSGHVWKNTRQDAHP